MTEQNALLDYALAHGWDDGSLEDLEQAFDTGLEETLAASGAARPSHTARWSFYCWSGTGLSQAGRPFKPRPTACLYMGGMDLPRYRRQTRASF